MIGALKRKRAGGARGALAAALCLVLALAGIAGADGISVDFTGQKAVNAYTLRDNLPEEPEKLNDDEVSYWAEDAAYQLEQFYLEQGYFQVEVKARTERPDPRAKDWKITLTVSEGKRYRFGKVRVIIDGDSTSGTVPEEVKSLQAREGRFYLEEDVVRDTRDLTRFYGNAGFVRASTAENVVVNDTAGTADVDYLVTRGEAVVFDALRVNIRRTDNDALSGLTDEDLLRSLVPYRRGDTVRVDQNDAIIEKLQATAQYNSVRLTDSLYADGRPGSVLTLDVEEKVPGRVFTSVFYETQYGFGVSADAKHSNVAGSLNEVRLGAGFAQNKQNAVVGYGSPLTLGMLIRFDNDLSVEWFQDNLPDEPFFGGDLRVANVASLSRNVTQWLRLIGGAEVEYKSRLVSDSLGTLSRESGGLLNFTSTGFVSFLDQALNPARGVRFGLTLGNGGPIYEQGEIQIFQDRHNWVDFKSAYYYYPPMLHQFKMGLRLDGGRFFGNGGQNADRFFLGGPRSVRSYGFRQLCPDAEAPARGSCPLTEIDLEPAYFLGSAELRLSPFDFPFVPPRGIAGFFKPMEFVPFVDFGKVWNLQSDEEFAFNREFLNTGYGQGIAYGGGIRYPLLGIFNMRLDFAWGRPGGGNWPDQWIVDLAQAF
jgi:outer membrane protein assembly factor BamA